MLGESKAQDRFPIKHKDSFGQTSSVLVGGAQWTYRLVRNTKIAMPHIAKGDVFTYQAQLNHDKRLTDPLDGFHIHIKPIGAVSAGQVISIDYAWVWLTAGEIFPDTLPNTGNCQIILANGDQYKTLVKNIVSSKELVNPNVVVTPMPAPSPEYYSSEFYIECTRRNDGTDTYAGEFALTFGDVHYTSDRDGSTNEYTD